MVFLDLFKHFFISFYKLKISCFHPILKSNNSFSSLTLLAEVDLVMDQFHLQLSKIRQSLIFCLSLLAAMCSMFAAVYHVLSLHMWRMGCWCADITFLQSTASKFYKGIYSEKVLKIFLKTNWPEGLPVSSFRKSFQQESCCT